MPKAKAVSGVYMISSPSGAFYIGSSVDVAKRWAGHKGALRNQRHHCQPLQRAAEKYGVEGLRLKLLAECPREDLRELEQLVIDMADPQYNSSRSTFEALTGLWQKPEFRAANTERARVLFAERRKSPEWQRRQREAASRALSETWEDPVFAAKKTAQSVELLRAKVNTPEVKAKAAQARRERYASDPEAARKRSELARALMLKLHADPEYRAKMIEASRERMRAMRADPEKRARNAAGIKAAHAKPVRCIETGDVFPSAEDAAKWCGLKAGGQITQAISGSKKTAGGYRWEKV
jgi:group I intron endonuclease